MNPQNKSPSLFLLGDKKEDMPENIGGKKSIHHINGQNRLERIFKYSHVTKQEEPVQAIDGMTYFIDVMLMARWTSSSVPFIVAALEVDTYIYGSQKKKSPAHLKKRDKAIMETILRPVIRIDVDILKEGRSKTKYYQTDEQIRQKVYDKITEFWANPEQYIKESQRD